MDMGLMAIACALGMPRGSGAGLMAMGRVAGWIAHAIEQKEMGIQLRPRSRFVNQREERDGPLLIGLPNGD